jgi:phenylalanyl-tRNA synthetase beta chain
MAEMSALLAPLGFIVESATADALNVRVPGHRRYDVTREDDLVEEIARRRGYNSFPEELRPFRVSVVPDDVMAQLEDRLRDRLVARGLLEARSMPLVAERDGDVPLLNPLAATESRLRRALLPGLVQRVAANFNRGARDIRLFEIGTAFAPGDEHGRPVESTRLAAIVTGSRTPDHWAGRPPSFDLWDLRGLMEEVAALLGAHVEPGSPADGAGIIALLDDTVFRVRSAGGDPVGVGGGIPHTALDAPAWAEAIWGVEFTLLPALTARPEVRFRPLPDQPPVDRDLALVVGRGVMAATLATTIRDAAGPLLERLEPFDVYQGPGIAPDARSVAFRLRFRARDRTLTVTEVDALMDRILERLKDEHHAERR